MKSGSLNLLEPSGPHRACYGTPLPPLPYCSVYLAIHDVRLVQADTNIFQANDGPSYWEPPCWYIGPETGCSWFFSVFPGICRDGTSQTTNPSFHILDSDPAFYAMYTVGCC